MRREYANVSSRAGVRKRRRQASRDLCVLCTRAAEVRRLSTWRARFERLRVSLLHKVSRNLVAPRHFASGRMIGESSRTRFHLRLGYRSACVPALERHEACVSCCELNARVGYSDTTEAYELPSPQLSAVAGSRASSSVTCRRRSVDSRLLLRVRHAYVHARAQHMLRAMLRCTRSEDQ